MAEPASTSSIGLMGLFVMLAGPLAGPYVYVLFGATLGAATALTRLEPANALAGIWFMLRIAGTALLFTAMGTYVAASVFPAIPIEHVMGGVAYLIGWRWDWISDRVLPWLLARVGIKDKTEGGPST